MKTHVISGLAFAVAAALAGCASQQASPDASKSAEPTPAPQAPVSRSVGDSQPQAAATQSSASVSKRSVYYDFDKYDVRNDQRGTVEANAKYLVQNPAMKVRIEGNADERGSREYNLALGQRRAESVQKAMSLLGVPSARMEAVSYGKERPVKTGHDEESWAENRRSDIVYPVK